MVLPDSYVRVSYTFSFSLVTIFVISLHLIFCQLCSVAVLILKYQGCVYYVQELSVLFMVTGPLPLDLHLAQLPHQEIYLVPHLHLEHLQHYLLVCHLEFLPLHKQVLGSLEVLLVRLAYHLEHLFLQ